MSALMLLIRCKSPQLWIPVLVGILCLTGVLLYLARSSPDGIDLGVNIWSRRSLGPTPDAQRELREKDELLWTLRKARAEAVATAESASTETAIIRSRLQQTEADRAIQATRLAELARLEGELRGQLSEAERDRSRFRADRDSSDRVATLEREERTRAEQQSALFQQERDTAVKRADRLQGQLDAARGTLPGRSTLLPKLVHRCFILAANMTAPAFDIHISYSDGEERKLIRDPASRDGRSLICFDADFLKNAASMKICERHHPSKCDHYNPELRR